MNKSTKGYSTDYSLIGLIGFSFLLLNQSVGIIDPTSDAGRVHPTDMAFSIGSFIFALIAYMQTFVYESDPSLRSTRLAASVIVAAFFTAAILQFEFHVRCELYMGFSLIIFTALIKAASSLVKYLYQIRCNMVKRSTFGVSKFAIWSDFVGTIFCFAQLQIDSVIAGYSSFLADPHVNLAKILIASFGLLNTLIILLQIHVIYGSKAPDQRQFAAIGIDTEIGLQKMLTAPLLGPNKDRRFSESYEIPSTDDSFHDQSFSATSSKTTAETRKSRVQN